MINRRNFIKNATLTSIAASSTIFLPGILKASSKKLDLLILGGTGFLGPHIVDAALAQGHKVTLFNRGKTNPHLYPELEKIVGDRKTKDIEKLVGRKFDAIIDTSAYFPRVVDLAMEVLKDNIGLYLLVSTISVYKDWSKPDMDEKSAVGVLDEPTTEIITNETYGPLKALCEKAAEKHMPGKVFTIRPGLIVGPLDKTDRFTYWPVRIKKGGEVLAPGDGSDFIQYIDVRDLAEWMIYGIEQQMNGIYNAQSNGRDITIKQLLDTCVKNLNPGAKLVWVDTSFLEKHDVTPWADMPVWIPAKDDNAGSGMMSSKKAYANGLKQRSIDNIVNDCYNWFISLPAERQEKLGAGISQEKEMAVLKAWNAYRSSSSGV